MPYIVGTHTSDRARLDTWIPPAESLNPLPACSEFVHVLGWADNTPVYVGPNQFSCGFCYLGPAHSVAKHIASVNRE